MAFKIEKGIALPTKRGVDGSGIADAVRAMEIGDSFVVEKGHQRISASAAAKREGRDVVSRANGDGTFRIWRTK